MTRAAFRAHVGNVLLVGKFDLRPLRDGIIPRGLPVLRTRKTYHKQEAQQHRKEFTQRRRDAKTTQSFSHCVILRAGVSICTMRAKACRESAEPACPRLAEHFFRPPHDEAPSLVKNQYCMRNKNRTSFE